MTAMEMAPGERCEIVVDLADGAPAGLLTLFEDQFDEEEAKKLEKKIKKNKFESERKRFEGHIYTTPS